MKVRALRDTILFKFIDSSSNGMFASKHSSLIITSDGLDGQRIPRWGKVEAIGPEVGPEIQVGTYILIDALKWTTGLQLTNELDSKIWQTTYENVSAVSDEEISQY